MSAISAAEAIHCGLGGKEEEGAKLCSVGLPRPASDLLYTKCFLYTECLLYTEYYLYTGYCLYTEYLLYTEYTEYLLYTEYTE